VFSQARKGGKKMAHEAHGTSCKVKASSPEPEEAITAKHQQDKGV